MLALEKHIGRGVMDYVIANNGLIPKRILKRYEKQNSFPVKIDKKELRGIK